MLTAGSLFSGIGGLDLGYERAGFQILWQCEPEPFCRAALAKHWPGVPCFMDVREIHAPGVCGGICENCVPPVDVLIGGFPCQDVSDAGQRKGIDGERSGLWKEYARLIRELRAHGLRGVGIENVAGLFVRGIDTVLADLAEIGMDAEWEVVRASDPDIGAPHRRARVFIVAYPRCLDGDRRPGGWSDHERYRDHAGWAETPRSAEHDGASGQSVADTESGRQRVERCEAWPGGVGYLERRGGAGVGDASSSRQGDAGEGDTGPECLAGWDAAAGAGVERLADPTGEGPQRHQPEGGEGRIHGVDLRPAFPAADFWPARPGHDQHPWEPPRCLESAVGARAHGVSRGLAGWRRASLQAVGNAVVPQCAERQARRLRAILEAR
jgi:DNA (cytosine-5)-methyltransferase 1